MKKIIFITICISLILGLLLQGNFLHKILLMAAVPLGFILLVLLLCYLEFFHRKNLPKKQKLFYASVTLIIGIPSLSYGIGAGIREWRHDQAEQFVLETIPLLEKHHRELGIYPSDLTELGISSLPTLLPNGFSYHRSQDGYSFSYHNPASFMSRIVYTAKDETWRPMDD